MEIKEGKKAPAFTLPNQNEENVSLKDFKGKWVVLYFYPKDNTPGCTTEAVEFTQKLPEFKKLGAIVLGCSKDSPQSHCKFIDKKDLKITLLSDLDHEVIDKYGAWGKKKFMGREFMGIIRSTFLIDPQGKIARIWSPVKVKGHVDDVLLELKEKV